MNEVVVVVTPTFKQNLTKKMFKVFPKNFIHKAFWWAILLLNIVIILSLVVDYGKPLESAIYFLSGGGR